MNLYIIMKKVKKIDFVQNRGSSPEQRKMNLYKIRKNYFVQIKSKISSGVSKIQVLINLFFFIIRNLSGLSVQIPFILEVWKMNEIIDEERKERIELNVIESRRGRPPVVVGKVKKELHTWVVRIEP